MAEGKEELLGKARANLRIEQLRKLLGSWEQRRDELYDEIAFRKGQVELLEEFIKSAFEHILDVNKEEQAKEKIRLDTRVEELTKRHEEEEEKKRQDHEEEEEKKRQEIAKKVFEEKQKNRKPRRKRPEEKAVDVLKRKTEAKTKKGK